MITLECIYSQLQLSDLIYGRVRRTERELIICSKIWMEVLPEEMTDQDLRAAFRSAFKNSTFPPSPADVAENLCSVEILEEMIDEGEC